MKYFLNDNWMVTVKFAIRLTDIKPMDERLPVLTISFYASVDIPYLEISVIAWKILRERMRIDQSQCDTLIISELTLALCSD